MSEPHINGTAVREFYIIIIGASLSEPHINGTNVREIYYYYYDDGICYVRHSLYFRVCECDDHYINSQSRHSICGTSVTHAAAPHMYGTQCAIYSNTSLEAA